MPDPTAEPGRTMPQYNLTLACACTPLEPAATTAELDTRQHRIRHRPKKTFDVKTRAKQQQGQCHLVSSRKVDLGGFDSRRGCATSDLQHPGGRVVTPLDGGYPLKPLQVLDQVAALVPQHAKVCQLQPHTCSAKADILHDYGKAEPE